MSDSGPLMFGGDDSEDEESGEEDLENGAQRLVYGEKLNASRSSSRLDSLDIKSKKQLTARGGTGINTRRWKWVEEGWKVKQSIRLYCEESQVYTGARRKGDVTHGNTATTYEAPPVRPGSSPTQTQAHRRTQKAISALRSAPPYPNPASGTQDLKEGRNTPHSAGMVCCAGGKYARTPSGKAGPPPAHPPTSHAFISHIQARLQQSRATSRGSRILIDAAETQTRARQWWGRELAAPPAQMHRGTAAFRPASDLEWRATLAAVGFLPPRTTIARRGAQNGEWRTDTLSDN
ncbi:hypothetical protein B0H11DRAFT_1903753 [Mycena galericulata]|nr:hypothetical protein B0H11DRAFT_1903753 [Mycena galericulata]